jgi:hypothetical protein
LTRTLLTEIDEVIEVIKVKSESNKYSYYQINDIGFEITVWELSN